MNKETRKMGEYMMQSSELHVFTSLNQWNNAAEGMFMYQPYDWGNL